MKSILWLLLVAALPVHAGTLRCKSALLTEGDTTAELLIRHCGARFLAVAGCSPRYVVTVWLPLPRTPVQPDPRKVNQIAGLARFLLW